MVVFGNGRSLRSVYDHGLPKVLRAPIKSTLRIQPVTLAGVDGLSFKTWKEARGRIGGRAPRTMVYTAILE